LTGALDELSPLVAEGTIGTDETRLKAAVEQMRLVPLNAYLEPALRYEITSGVARIDSTIVLQDAALHADNDVVLSRFGMVGAGDAAFERELGVPLTVALALMKDVRGDISFRVPVHGDLAARQYRVGSVFVDALKAALAGAVRTPVRLLGSVFRRDQGERFDLKPVPFLPGSAELGPDGEQRIAQVARLLERHAGLRAVLIPEPSGADLERFRDEAMIARLEAMPAEQRAPDAVALLELLRARRAGASPLAIAGQLRTALTALEAETPLPLDQLEVLATARADTVARRLIESHGIAADRVRRTRWEPEVPRPETPPGVDLQLRGD
jgi:hypothetical protein